MTKIKEIGHAVLHVSDVATSSDWYCDILGVEVVIAADGLPARFLSFGRKDHDLALFESGHRSRIHRRLKRRRLEAGGRSSNATPLLRRGSRSHLRDELVGVDILHHMAQQNFRRGHGLAVISPVTLEVGMDHGALGTDAAE